MNHPVLLTLGVAFFGSAAVTLVVVLAVLAPILLVPVAVSAVFPSIEGARMLFMGGRRMGAMNAMGPMTGMGGGAVGPQAQPW
jgi:hypothetical protein